MRSTRSTKVVMAAAHAAVGFGSVLLTQHATAATYTWANAGTGAWSLPANWTGGPAGTIPGNIAADIAVSSSPGTALIDSAVPLIDEVRWSNNAAGSNGFINIVPGGSLSVTKNFSMGRGAGRTATLTMTGGSLTTINATGTALGDVIFGDQANTSGAATGVLNMTGGTITAANNVILAQSVNGVNKSTGTATQSDGTVNGQAVIVGGSGNATYTLSGSGILNQLGSNPTGHADGRDALVVANNGTFNTTTGVGSASVATFNQNGGTVNVNGGLIIADSVVGVTGNLFFTNGTYNMTAGVLDLNAKPITLGVGNATINFDGGTVQDVVQIKVDTGTNVGTRTVNFNGSQIIAGATSTSW